MFSFRSINTSTSNNQPYNNNIMFSLYSYPTKDYGKINQNKIILQNPEPVIKLKWGEPIWNLFHVIAEKITPEHFFNIRTELFDIIKSICYNLPCPECAHHARDYINSVNFNLITKPEHLKQMFFHFHNNVNQRKNMPIFNIEKLTTRYESMNLNTALQVFLYHFKDKHKTPHMIANDNYRFRIAIKIQKWFSNNIGKFNL
jgi:hypothetical protein